MIHQVTISKENKEYLDQIIELQLSLLRLAASGTAVTNEKIEFELGPKYGASIQSVATWVTGKKTSLLKPLNDFATFPESQSTKNAFIDIIEADITLLSSQKSGRLKATFIELWQKAAGTFLLAFYKQFSHGFEEYLFSSNLAYGRQHFIKNFIQENNGLYLCAVCDTVAYRSSSDQHTYTSIDHFFPKSLYPHLAIHPYNLIPICSLCNSAIKGSEDPLKQLADIKMILLPYSKQPGLRDQAFLHFQERGYSSARTLHPLELLFKQLGSFSSQDLIANFNNIYKIQTRWNEDLDQLDQHVYRRITQFLLGDMQNGAKPENTNWLVDRLNILMGLVFTEDLGSDPFGFATTWLIHYHITCLTTSVNNEQTPLQKSLIAWADNQQQHIQRMRDKAQELSDRTKIQL